MRFLLTALLALLAYVPATTALLTNPVIIWPAVFVFGCYGVVEAARSVLARANRGTVSKTAATLGIASTEPPVDKTH